MRVRIDWYDEENDEAHQLDGTVEYDDSPTVAALVGNVASRFERRHDLVVDFGGDDDWLELTLADVDAEEAHGYATELLAAVEAVLKKS